MKMPFRVYFFRKWIIMFPLSENEGKNCNSLLKVDRELPSILEFNERYPECSNFISDSIS
jgi:hypothetical protein